MADIRTTNVTNDLKVRPAFDIDLGTGSAAAQFLNTMMASIGGTAQTPDNGASATSNSLAPASSYAQRVRDAKTAERPDAPARTKPASPKDDLSEKIQAKMAELAARNDTPLTDDRAVKALKKLASFLLQAHEQGQLDLPAAMTDKLEQFVAKIDAAGTELKAADIALFLHDFAKIFRQMHLVTGPATSAPVPVDSAEQDTDNINNDAALLWPPEIAAAFAELKLAGHVKPDRPVTALDVLKAVKTLVSLGEKNALQALRDGAQAALSLQSDAQILIPVATVDKTIEKPGSVLPNADIAHVTAAVETLKPADAHILAAKAAIAQAPLALKPDRDISAETVLAADGQNTNPGEPVDLLLDATAPQNAKSDSRAEAKPDPQQAFKNNTPVSPQAALVAAAVAQVQKNSESNNATSSSPAFVADAAAALSDGVDGANPLAPASAGHNRFAKALNAATQAQQNQPSNATQQVLVQIQNRAAKSSHINVQLTPAELGRVDVRLNIGRDGQTYAVVMADKPETLALLQRDAAALEKSLQNAGLNASAGNMSFNLREQRQQDTGGFSRGKRLMRDEKADTATELALNVHSNGQIISDTRVNYHA